MDAYDPESAYAPAPRHELESNAPYDDALSNDLPEDSPRPVVVLDFSQKVSSRGDGGRPLVVAVGEAGMVWSLGFDGDGDGKSVTEDAAILVDGVQQGSVSLNPKEGSTTVVFVSSALPLNALHEVAENLVTEFGPSRITIIDIYSVPAYIDPSNGDRQPVSPIRYLSSQGLPESLPSSIKHFATPNLVSGLSAALMAEALYASIPSLLVLLPSPMTFTQPSSSGPLRKFSETNYDFGVGSPHGQSFVVDVLRNSVNLSIDRRGWEDLDDLSGRDAWGWRDLGWKVDRIVGSAAAAGKRTFVDEPKGGFAFVVRYEKELRKRRRLEREGDGVGMYI